MRTSHLIERSVTHAFGDITFPGFFLIVVLSLTLFVWASIFSYLIHLDLGLSARANKIGGMFIYMVLGAVAGYAADLLVRLLLSWSSGVVLWDRKNDYWDLLGSRPELWSGLTSLAVSGAIAGGIIGLGFGVLNVQQKRRFLLEFCFWMVSIAPILLGSIDGVSRIETVQKGSDVPAVAALLLFLLLIPIMPILHWKILKKNYPEESRANKLLVIMGIILVIAGAALALFNLLIIGLSGDTS